MMVHPLFFLFKIAKRLVILCYLLTDNILDIKGLD